MDKRSAQRRTFPGRSSRKPGGPVRYAVTIGDPSGIGPEMVLRAASRLRCLDNCTIYGSRAILKTTARDLRLSEGFRRIEPRVVDVVGDMRFEYGRSTKRTARAAMLSIQAALESGSDVIVTAPIVKATVRMIEPDFIGHTEYIADFYGVRDHAMTGLWHDKRIMMLTTHLPLRDIFKKINGRMVRDKICLFGRGLSRYFGIERPEIGVAAVNPHAFEFSKGEDEEIAKGIAQARKRGVRAKGPFAGDTLFSRKFDGYVAIYHDQAMVYLKSKRSGLNFTLGLPVVRLSPLCGAALDIAGKGCADVSGFVAAFGVGRRIYRNMREYQERNVNEC